MDKKVGVWLDHEKAFLVAIDGKKETRTMFPSDVENKTKSHGGYKYPGVAGGFEIVSEQKIERKRREHLKSWYRELIAELGKADRIFLLGPGSAKTEFLHEIENNRDLADKVVAVEPAEGKMTENQIAAAVKTFFGNSKAGEAVPQYRKAPGT
ncbi:hypothetical protein EPN96_07535 [bacterium]|nr:MAG: hypothetical protein EPN96_07535 [bacterium]